MYDSSNNVVSGIPGTEHSLIKYMLNNIQILYVLALKYIILILQH